MSLPPRSFPLATLVWFDPGATTGMCVLGIDARWLAGEGGATWEGMRRAIRRRWFGQVGTNGREWNDDDERAKVTPDLMRIVPEVHPDKRPRFDRVLGHPDIYQTALAIDQCADLLLAWPRAAWGHESFQLRTMAADLSPVSVIAALTHAELRYGPGRTPYRQTASIAKTTATDDRLKMAGLYRAGMGHATDAARHCATFLRKARADAWLRAEAWPGLFKQ